MPIFPSTRGRKISSFVKELESLSLVESSSAFVSGSAMVGTWRGGVQERRRREDRGAAAAQERKRRNSMDRGAVAWNETKTTTDGEKRTAVRVGGVERDEDDDRWGERTAAPWALRTRPTGCNRAELERGSNLTEPVTGWCSARPSLIPGLRVETRRRENKSFPSRTHAPIELEIKTS
jgi:hypothetical protein